MNDDKFWLRVWGIIGIVIMVISYLIFAYWTDHNEKIVALIAKGVNPVEAMCALQDDYGKHPTCIILATKRALK